MEETRQEFEQEIKTALKYSVELEKHIEDMDTDDAKYLCQKIMLALERVLKDVQEGKLKEKKF